MCNVSPSEACHLGAISVAGLIVSPPVFCCRIVFVIYLIMLDTVSATS